MLKTALIIAAMFVALHLGTMIESFGHVDDLIIVGLLIALLSPWIASGNF